MMTFNFRRHSDNSDVSYSIRVSTMQRSITIREYLRMKVGNVSICTTHCITVE